MPSFIPPMFHWDDGLKLTKADLALDFHRRQPRAFISHAHTDHIAPHAYALCTAETAALYRHRLGPRRTLDMVYRRPIDWGGLRLTAFPAGHCLGSAMLLAEDGDQSLLYTGDFKLSESATAERAELPHAEILVIESTFGTPDYRLPPRNLVIEQLLELISQCLAEGSVPIVLAYALGKAQEVTKIFTSAGVPVVQHRKAFEISQIYSRFGVDLGRYELFKGRVESGWALVAPPGAGGLDDVGRQTRIAVTGWAVDKSAKYRFQVDHAVPLSDHADYDELIEAVGRVAPRIVYCTHGPESFVDRLHDAGFNAHPLGKDSQKRLF